MEETESAQRLSYVVQKSRMTTERYKKHFSFVAALIKLITENQNTAPMTEVHTRYSEMWADEMGYMGHRS